MATPTLLLLSPAAGAEGSGARGAPASSALQQAQRELRETQALLNMAAQLGQLGAWAWDVSAPRMTWSGEVCAIHGMPLGYAPTTEEAIGFFAPEYRETMSETLSACLASGSPFDVEGEIVTRRGQRVWVRALGEAEWNEHGGVVRIHGALQDISGSKRAAERELRMAEDIAAALERRVSERTEQLEMANRELEAFSYSIAHDLRAPLSSIDGFSKMLQHGAGDALPDRCRHYLDRIQAGVRQMAELTDGLLALANLSRASLRLEPVDLAALARTLLDTRRHRAPGREMQVEVAPELMARGDARLLNLLMGNLVDNAWKFTSRTARPCIRVGAVEDCDGATVFFVGDNGAGFDMAYAQNLFQPFHRMHGIRDFEGTGIGLAIVHKIVARHGGRVWAQAAPGEGATFHFTLPSR